MSDLIRVLAVDDHEMIALGYKYTIEGCEFDAYNVVVNIAPSYEEGKAEIESSASRMPYDIILLDIQMFPESAKEERGGIDLGLLAKKISPTSKVVFLSSFSDSYHINNVLKTVNPDGYMVKSEVDEKTLQDMVKTVIEKPPYYTAAALQAIRRKMANEDQIDERDKKILYQLSIGTKTKDISSLVAASSTTVENRKRQLKIIFNVENGNDFALIEEARKRGFI
ncbi:response regulator [Zobellia galactanivorans]|uniref:Two-component system-Response regulator n=2 Tax=Zobellia TaxID=112040 RepID=G0L740_ZOBGA|nr:MULTISPECIES: response regulator [Zobellia]MBU3027057.1 response regulator [Zobellia galactanivorans]MDO6517040.1 response regulator [Zobellia uliginosa]MDO6808013.1 response regulator [Zobellia galactanivorans]OWW24910.1 response regulator [Zobellia sp. OII3]CAZ98875.1 Two-component system-Response regulator [Zobellia galactanivorans]